MPYKVKLKCIVGRKVDGAKWSLPTYRTKESARRAVQREFGDDVVFYIKKVAVEKD